MRGHDGTFFTCNSVSCFLLRGVLILVWALAAASIVLVLTGCCGGQGGGARFDLREGIFEVGQTAAPATKTDAP